MAGVQEEKFSTNLRSFDFVMSKDVSNIPEQSTTQRIGAWHVGYSNGLTLSKFTVAGYDAVHLLAIVDPKVYLREDFVTPEGLEQQLIGGFVMVLQKSEGIEVRSDACGMLPVVYSPADEIVASCPSKIVSQAYSSERCAMIRTQDISFSFGQTAKPNVYRLMPNHTLHLNGFDVRRSWHIESLPSGVDPDVLVDQIVEALQEILVRLHDIAPLCMPLTAGRDSRALIACANGLENVRTYTSIIDEAAAWDSSIATKIAKELKIDYTPLPFIEPDATNREKWLRNIGYSVGGRVSYGFLTSPRDSQSWLIMGLCGELGRNHYPSFERRPNPANLLEMVHADANKESLRAAEEWLLPLSNLSGRQLADLLYQEARIGSWAGPQMACPAHFRGRIAPFASRRILNCNYQITGARRANNWVPQQVIARANQSLLRYRFTRRGKRETLRVGLERIGLHRLARKF